MLKSAGNGGIYEVYGQIYEVDPNISSAAFLEHHDNLAMEESMRENQLYLFQNFAKEGKYISCHTIWGVVTDHLICCKHHCIKPIYHFRC